MSSSKRPNEVQYGKLFLVQATYGYLGPPATGVAQGRPKRIIMPYQPPPLYKWVYLNFQDPGSVSLVAC